jgi:hypothetical protein
MSDQIEGHARLEPRELRVSLAPVANNSFGTTGGVLGITGFVLSWIPFLGILIGLVTGILAVIFGALGRSSGRQPTGMATTGLVLGILTIVLKLIPGINIL